MTTDTAIVKVDTYTKEQIRLGAAVFACTQGEFVQRAVAEFIEGNAGDLIQRMDRARAALLGGEETIAAYLAESEPTTVQPGVGGKGSDGSRPSRPVATGETS
jgi:hypothetical protein